MVRTKIKPEVKVLCRLIIDQTPFQHIFDTTQRRLNIILWFFFAGKALSGNSVFHRRPRAGHPAPALRAVHCHQEGEHQPPTSGGQTTPTTTCRTRRCGARLVKRRSDGSRSKWGNGRRNCSTRLSSSRRSLSPWSRKSQRYSMLLQLHTNDGGVIDSLIGIRRGLQ